MPDLAPLDPERLVTILARHEVRYVMIGAMAAMLARADLWNLVTSAGRLDIAFAPSGTDGYADLMEDAVPFDVFGVRLNVASLEDIIRSKEAADRSQDRHDVVILREMLRRAR